MSTKKGSRDNPFHVPGRRSSKSGWRDSVARVRPFTQLGATPVVNSKTTSSPGVGTPVTQSYTAPANSMIVLDISTYGLANQFVTVASITDNAGLTWKRRRQVTYESVYPGTGTSINSQAFTKEIWWAYTTVAQTSKTITINLNNSGNQTSSIDVGLLFVTGVVDINNPWDNQDYTQGVASYSDTTTAGTINPANTTISNNALVLGWLTEIADASNPTASAAGSGYTQQNATSRGTSSNLIITSSVSKQQGSPGQTTQPFVVTKKAALGIVDAISGNASAYSNDVTAQPSGLFIDGTPSGFQDTSGTISSISTAITTNYKNDVLIVAVDIDNFAGAGGAGALINSVVTDTNGLTWNLRSRSQGKNTGNTFSQTLEVWWAVAPNQITAGTVTATFVAAVGGAAAVPSQSSAITVFAVGGSPTPLSPWDSNVSLPATTSHMTGVSAALSQSGTTTSTKAMVFGFMNYNKNGHADSTDPAGWTVLKDYNAGAGFQASKLYKLLASAGTQTVTWTTSQDFWQVAVDALTGDATGASGTIATNLTKANIAALGTTFQNVTGTITTNLTKASFAVSGWAEVIGSATTSLSKARNAALAALEIFTGTITTHLTKANFSGQGWATVRGTVTTSLSGISQVAHDLELFTGAIATNLSRIAQSAAAVTNGSDTFGTIVTALSHVNFAASAVEAIPGTIVTALPAHSIQMIGDVEEIFTGTITMNLGAENGAAFGNVIIAEEIIEGPINMTLPTFRPLILGAKLGTPGIGKWYSWRYTDS